MHCFDRVGGVETFNLFYKHAAEQFVSLLEDEMVVGTHFLRLCWTEIGKYPNVLVAWCNQRVWGEELPKGSWVDTGRFVNPPEKHARLI